MDPHPNPSGPGPGLKFDTGKPQPTLVPPFAEAQVVEVLTLGAAKYAPENWRLVMQSPGGRDRYLNAALRHLGAYRQGHHHDSETGCHPLAHTIASLLFVLEGDLLGYGLDKEDTLGNPGGPGQPAHRGAG